LWEKGFEVCRGPENNDRGDLQKYEEVQKHGACEKHAFANTKRKGKVRPGVGGKNTNNQR